MIVSDDYEAIDYNTGLIHYGTPRHSGRYPWGSGENPYQHETSFISHVSELRKQGFTDTQIAKSMDMTTTQFRAKMSNYTQEVRAQNISMAVRLKAKGYSNTAIGERMGVGESQIRAWLKQSEDIKKTSTGQLADALAKELDNGGYLDVGAGTESYLGVSETTLTNALQVLKDRGYTVTKVQVDQLGTGPGQKTTIRVLAPKGTTYVDAKTNTDKIRVPNVRSEDNGKTLLGMEPPVSINKDRVMIQYGDQKGKDGAYGVERDGVILLRPGVKDISLGGANYAQVRIAVHGGKDDKTTPVYKLTKNGVDFYTQDKSVIEKQEQKGWVNNGIAKYNDGHYIKGMAMYGDPSMFPKGVDVIFNTNKDHTKAKMDVLKPMKINGETGEIDNDNPFGATIKNTDSLRLAQRYYTDKNGKKQQSVINIVNEEGDWGKWHKSLASQVVSKQTPDFAQRQLSIALKSKQAEFDDIKSLTNPVVKKKMLNDFAENCDSDAVHLKAAALPRQASYVILPFPKMSEREIYAPKYNNGEEVALIRYPHAGIFEIPTLRVNNKNQEAKKALGNSGDAVGINSKVAARLSGADFDGDSVLVIPTRGTGLKTSKPLSGLKDFDPSAAYPGYEGMHVMTDKEKQPLMGDVSNLITDMTIKGAPEEDIVRAVRHSMVVIDSPKHKLNYKQSYIDNGIAELKEKYQGGANRGASTIVSKAKSPERVHTRKAISPDPKTGKKRYLYTNETYTKNGKVIFRTVESTKMAETSDARTLMSGPNHEGTPIERIYANHANALKSLANEARKEAMAVPKYQWHPSASKVYQPEINHLKAEVEVRNRNKPLERQAQILGNLVVSEKLKANPEIRDDKDAYKKLKNQAISGARQRIGASQNSIILTDREWEAIQAGAISKNMLEQVLTIADQDQVKQLATPKPTRTVSPSVKARILNMQATGATQAEIAEAIGVSVSTVSRALA